MVERKHLRKKRALLADDAEDGEEEEQRRLALEEMKFLQKQRERKAGIPANEISEAVVSKIGDNNNNNINNTNKAEGEGEKEELVLQDTFAQETAVTVEDPNMLKYVEQELAKKRGKQIGKNTEETKPPEDDLYVVPDHLKVRRRNSEESSTQWTTGIAEVQLPIEYKLRNIEETEAAKKQLQDKRQFVGRGRPQSSIPSSYSADYFQRGREYAEKLEEMHQTIVLNVNSTFADHPELYKDKDAQNSGSISGEIAPEGNVGNRRQAATDEIMLERFRKRERSRLMRR